MIKIEADYLGVRLPFPVPVGVGKKDPVKNPNILTYQRAIDTLERVNIFDILDYIYAIGCNKLVVKNLGHCRNFAAVRAHFRRVVDFRVKGSTLMYFLGTFERGSIFGKRLRSA